MDNQKRKNQSPLRVIVNGWGFLLSTIMLAIGFAIGLFGALYLAPELLGFDITATHLAESAILLAATEADVNSRELSARDTATAFDRDSLATDASLNNAGELLHQTATQSFRNVIGTQTAFAVEDTRLRTQIALNFQSTQSRLQQNATDIELDYRNTQAALGISGNSTAESQIVARSTATPTVTASATFLPPPSNTTTPTPASLLLDLAQGLPQSWRISRTSDWSDNERGALALQNGAWFLLDTPFGGAYTFSITFAPALVVSTDYDVLLNVQETGGLVLRIHGEALSANEVTLYRYQGQFTGVPETDNMTVLAQVATNTVLQNPTQLTISMTGERIRVAIDDAEVLTTQLDGIEPIGALGIQFPAGALIQQVQTTP